MDIHSSHIDGVGDFVEFLPGAGAERVPQIIIVPEGATALAIGVGDVDGDSFRVVETARVSVRYIGDRGPEQAIDTTRDTDTESALVLAQGVISYINLQPAPGRWEVLIQHAGEAVFAVHVSVFVRPLKALRTFAKKHRCKACKAGIRAALYAVLAKLTAGAVVFLDIGELIAKITAASQAVVQFLANVVGIGAGTLQSILSGGLDFLELETPFERLVRRICEELGLCPKAAKPAIGVRA